MPITITCRCGTTATVSDDYAGKRGTCRACNAVIIVPQPPPSSAAVQPPAPPTPDFTQPTVERLDRAGTSKPERREVPLDPAFDRDVFLLRQKHLAINEKYIVWDDRGNDILFVERPSHLFRNLLALLAGAAAGIAVFTFTGFTCSICTESLRGFYVFAGIMTGVLAIFAVYIALEQKRHVEFYRDEGKREKLLRVIQDRKMQLLNATYTITDAGGRTIGTFRKNYLLDIVLKHWECRDARGNVLFVAREDSIVKAILRRLLGPLLGLLKLDFIFRDPRSGETIGQFNRSFTILDRYALDLSGDLTRRIDRRLALAMGVMLDTGERR